MADGTIDIDVKLNGSPAEAQAAGIGQKLGAQVSKGVDAAAASAKKSTQQAMNEIGGTLTSFGSKYTKAVTLPIAAAAVATGASAVKIDTALTGVRKTVDGTEQQYEALKDAAIEFSKTNAVDPAQILDIQALGAQLGYTIDELDMFGEVVSGLDIATNMDAETAATELAQFANIMGMAHDETKQYGSTIVELGNNFAATEADISHMAMRIAGAGKQIGLTEADVLGLATALSSMGIEAEAGGTAISTIMANIDKEVATNGKYLETWAQTANMSVDEFVNAWGTDAVGALSAVLVGMDAATEAGGNMSVMLDELDITSIRQTDTLKRLASNSEFLGRAVETANDAWRDNTALDKEVENRNNSMASQLEILKNKVMAVAIEVGEPLMKALIGIIDAADPLIDALASGAKAFADLDEDGKRLVLMAVGIVAAFGPIVGVTGKVITGINNTSNAWKSFAANIKTVKTNLTDSAKATANSAAAWGKYRTAGTGAAAVTVKFNDATKKATVVQSQAVTATKAQTVAMKASTTATKAGTVAMNAAKVAGNALKASLMAIAPVAAITIAIELFTALSGAIQGAAEKAKLYEDSTRGLEDAAAGLTVKVDEEVDAFASLSSAIEQVDVKKLAEEHRDLANSITEASQSAATNQAMLGQYGDAIQQLAGRSDLTEQEVAKLKIAVDGVNEACGTSYEVVQDSAGAYQLMADGAIVAKDSIYEVVEAQKAQIRAEVEAENYKAVYQQMAKDQEALAEATRNAAAAEEAMNKRIEELGDARYSVNQVTGETIDLAQKEVDAYMEASSALEDVKGQAGSTQSALNRLEEQQILTAMAMENGASAFIKAADSNLQFKSAVQGMGVNLVEFTSALQDMGYSAEQISNMTSEQAAKMAQGWQQGTDSLISATEELGLEVPEKLRQMGDDANSEVAKSSKSIESSTKNFVQGTQSQLNKIDGKTPAGKATGDWVSKIASAAGASKSAAANDASNANAGFNTIDGKTPGQKGSLDFAQGITKNAEKAKTSGKLGANKAKAGFQSNDGQAKTWGEHLTQAWSRGISAASDYVSMAANGVANIVKGILGHSIPKDGPLREGGKGEAIWGEHLVQNIIDGMMNKKPALTAATKDLAQDINDELMAELQGIDPMKQLTESITRGSAALNLSAMMVGAAPSYTTNTQNVTFAGAVTSPDIIAREMRLQNMYGLAGQWQ